MIALEIPGGALVLRDGMAPHAVRSLDAVEQAGGTQPVENPVEGHTIHFAAVRRRDEFAGEFLVRKRLTGTLEPPEYGNGKGGGTQPGLPKA